MVSELGNIGCVFTSAPTVLSWGLKKLDTFAIGPIMLFIIRLGMEHSGLLLGTVLDKFFGMKVVVSDKLFYHDR